MMDIRSTEVRAWETPRRHRAGTLGRIPLIAAAVLLLVAGPALAQDDTQEGAQQQNPQTETLQGVPTTAEDVARPDDQATLTDAQFALVQVATGFADPIKVESANDGSGRLFVVERLGRVKIVENGQVLDKPFLDISGDVLSAFLEQGLYDIVFHPKFKENGRVFVHFAELLRNGDSVIVEYRVSKDDPNKLDTSSARMIMQIDQPWANHNGGELAFGPDGYLYIGSGDGGWEGDPLGAGQDLSTLLGKILRIDVDVPEDGYLPYAIPPGNPFATREGLVRLFGISEEQFAQLHTEARPEIFAYGLRNPYTFSFDPDTGDMYIADVGQNHWEEVSLLPAGAAGVNFGWDVRMGTHCFPIGQESCAQVGVLPIAEYSHEEGNCSVIDVGVSRNDALPGLDGAYLFADYCSGRVWATARTDQAQDGGGAAWTMQQLIDTQILITGSGSNTEGDVYLTSCVCTYGGGTPATNQPGSLWQLVPADEVPEGATTAPLEGSQNGGGQEGSQDGGTHDGDQSGAEGGEHGDHGDHDDSGEGDH